MDTAAKCGEGGARSTCERGDHGTPSTAIGGHRYSFLAPAYPRRGGQTSSCRGREVYRDPVRQGLSPTCLARGKHRPRLGSRDTPFPPSPSGRTQLPPNHLGCYTRGEHARRHLPPAATLPRASLPCLKPRTVAPSASLFLEVPLGSCHQQPSLHPRWPSPRPGCQSPPPATR